MLTFEMKVTVILLVIFAARIYQLAASSDRCITRTEFGFVRGKPMTSRNGRDFCAFLGVPYAAPPLGKLRFLPPTPPQTWDGIKDCEEEVKECLQKEIDGSEDCLYVNVFTHYTTANSTFPVMVYIHGGGFYMGSAALSWLGPENLMDKNIVLVTVQYRLGPFGFMSTEDEVIPGNMGLKDQVQALKWVQENIGSFCGDKSAVTIFGNSAGSASVHYHMMSPVSKPLFARAISQSGTALSSFALMGKGQSRNDTKELAMELDCPTNNSAGILECLQDKSSTQVLRAFLKKLKSRYGHSNKLFRPVVEVNTEHAFITENPVNIMTEKPWLVGLNADEGLWRIDQRINQTIHFIQTDFKNFWPFATQFKDLYSNLNEITNPIYKFYFENASTEDIITSFAQLTTDTWFAWPTEKAITHHGGPLYYYLYDHQAEHTYSQMYKINTLRRGILHTDELLMLFTQRTTFSPLNEQDSNVSKLLVDLWTNFATGGNPTPHPISSDPQDDNAETVVWSESGNSDPMYLHIKTNKIAMKRKLFETRMNFWRGVNFKNIE